MDVSSNFDRVLGHIHRGEWAEPWIVAFEYGGIGPIFEWRSEPTFIAEQIPRLRDIVAGETA